MNAEDVERIKHHFNVVAEGLRHDLQQVAEGHQVILSQVQQFREEVKNEFILFHKRDSFAPKSLTNEFVALLFNGREARENNRL